MTSKKTLHFRHYYDYYEVTMYGTLVARIIKITDGQEQDIKFLDLPEFIQDHIANNGESDD